MPVEYRGNAEKGQAKVRTWHEIRLWIADKHPQVPPGELRQTELKWRKIMAEAGFNVKGQ